MRLLWGEEYILFGFSLEIILYFDKWILRHTGALRRSIYKHFAAAPPDPFSQCWVEIIQCFEDTRITTFERVYFLASKTHDEKTRREPWEMWIVHWKSRSYPSSTLLYPVSLLFGWSTQKYKYQEEQRSSSGRLTTTSPSTLFKATDRHEAWWTRHFVWASDQHRISSFHQSN